MFYNTITTNAGKHNIAQVFSYFRNWRYVVMNEGNVMGNMSTLEQKVDVLLRFCMAKTEAERSACYGDLRQVQSAASEQI